MFKVLYIFFFSGAIFCPAFADLEPQIYMTKDFSVEDFSKPKKVLFEGTGISVSRRFLDVEVVLNTLESDFEMIASIDSKLAVRWGDDRFIEAPLLVLKRENDFVIRFSLDENSLKATSLFVSLNAEKDAGNVDPYASFPIATYEIRFED
ncbi:MAG: hypothetical protein ACQKBU_01880 [Verrucomicrobiales bacterium]